MSSRATTPVRAPLDLPARLRAASPVTLNMVTLFEKSSCRQPTSTIKHWEDILEEASHAPPLADIRSASAPQHRRPSPTKRRSLAKLEAEKQHATQAVANELVPQMEAAQSAYERETAALNAALQAHAAAAAAQGEQGSAHAAERIALAKQIGAVHTAHVAALKVLEATAHRRLAAIEETHQASIANANPSGRDSRESPGPLARTRAPAAGRPVCVPGAAADAPRAAATSVVAAAASPDGRRVTLGSRRRSLPSAASADYCVFHAPYNKLVRKAHARLALDPPPSCLAGDAAYEASLTDKGLDASLRKTSAEDYEKRVSPSTQAPQHIGNCYTASVFFGLVSLVSNAELNDKRIMVFSYGSGAVASMYVLRGQPGRFPLETMRKHVDLSARLAARVERSAAEFAAAVVPGGRLEVSTVHLART